MRYLRVRFGGDKWQIEKVCRNTKFWRQIKDQTKWNKNASETSISGKIITLQDNNNLFQKHVLLPFRTYLYEYKYLINKIFPQCFNYKFNE